MQLDYTTGSVNFRDVGAFINLIAGHEMMYKNLLFRGGKTDYCKSEKEIGSPKTIINLRQGKDKHQFTAEWMLHFPVSNDHEKYNTSIPDVRIWLNEVIKTFEDSSLPLPLFVHCLSGKDRTGIVIGCLLMILDIPRELIVEEYLLSDGDVRKELFDKALDGIGHPEMYFKKRDYPKIKSNLTHWFLKV